MEKEADEMGAKAMQMKKYSSNTSPNQIKPSTNERAIQRKVGDSYGKARVNDDLKKHMAGEWNGENSTSLKGGHWFPGMKLKWGNNKL